MEDEILKNIPEPLILWYEKNARALPWREDPSPYHVWVSEIMLQQTRVEAVRAYYDRFIRKLKDIRSLADCPEEKLLKLWEGLGYYSRARNMKKAAQIVMDSFHGVLPDSVEDLLTLPGIGSYTAGAIASIAYGKAEPAVDANVWRVLSRITENEEDIQKQSVKRQAGNALKAVMPKDCPGKFNQALMELGELICLPNAKPECEACPISDLCAANRDQRQLQFPALRVKKPRRIEDRTVFVICDKSHAAIRRRPERGLLAGLYELPNLKGHLSKEEALDYASQLGFSPIRIQSLSRAKHVFTHVEWHMSGYLVLVKEEPELPGPKGKGILFPAAGEILRNYPIPSAFSAYTQKIFERLPSL